MNISLLAVAAAAASLIGHASVAAPAPQRREAAAPSAALTQRLATFDYVWSEIRDKYYDPRFNGVDWEAVRERYRPSAAAAANEAAFQAVLRGMVGELRDAHTRILSEGQVSDRRNKQSTSTGAILFEVEGQPVVYDVVPGSPAAEAGLRPGMRVLAVNGVAAEEAFSRSLAEVGPSSSPRAARVLGWLRLAGGPATEPLRLRLARRDGEIFEVSLPRRPIDARPRFESRMLPSGDLYVRFDRFRKPVARLFAEALKQNPGARGLVLDLRSNTGGDGKEGVNTVAPLLDRPVILARLATRTGKAPSALMGLVKLPLELTAGRADGRLFAGPMAILVNEGTGSTSEVIAAGLQERGRAKVVGTRSCGCALGVLRHRKLPGGGALAISEVGLITGLGRRIEGEGVVPDVPIALRLSDLSGGSDRGLAAALDELEGMRGARR